MILIGLKDTWDQEFIEALSNELRLLISPYRGINDFNVDLTVIKDNTRVVKSISSDEILATANWKVRAKVDENGKVQAEFINNKSGEQVKLAPIEWNQWIKNQGVKPLFGPLTFEFHYLPRDLEALKNSIWVNEIGSNLWILTVGFEFIVMTLGSDRMASHQERGTGLI
ncbi:hypothetical protein LNO81_31315 [Klebsiella variicola subsp. variicola]|nr:hypothetical protein [Klebsiella variicola subsp. variicola]